MAPVFSLKEIPGTFSWPCDYIVANSPPHRSQYHSVG